MTTITATTDGPYKVENATILDAEGNVLKEGTAFLCRCGHSKNKPFCDASHKASGFKA